MTDNTRMADPTRPVALQHVERFLEAAGIDKGRIIGIQYTADLECAPTGGAYVPRSEEERATIYATGSPDFVALHSGDLLGGWYVVSTAHGYAGAAGFSLELRR